MCCSVMQCIAVCGSVLQFVALVATTPKTRTRAPRLSRRISLIPGVSVAECCPVVCCSVLQCVAVCCSVLQCVAVCCRVVQCVAVCCCVLLCAVCCSALQYVAVYYSVSRCVAACCSVLQCRAATLKPHVPDNPPSTSALR